MAASPDFQQSVDAVAEALDADIVTYFGDVIRGEDNFLIDQCRTRQLRKNVLLLLATYGGDPNAAYRISRAFQEAYNTRPPERTPGQQAKSDTRAKGGFWICIDGICKSAGTIICLGADKLIMSERAEIGPIDVQLRKQDEVGERTSGLTPIQAVNFLETQSVVLFKRHFKALRESAELGFSTKMAAEIATEMAVGLLTPIYQQIDPIRLAEVDRSLRISKDYGDRLKCNDNLKADAIEKLLAKYPSHGFVIDRREASELFSVVEELKKPVSDLLEIFGPISQWTLDKSGETFVYFVSSEPKETESQPEPTDGPGPQESQNDEA